MRQFQQFTRSYVTISMLTLMLLVGFSGMGFANENKVDVNAATTKQLKTLPGIGKELAQRIVNYRTSNGEFKSVQELVQVRGIGKNTLAKMEERLTIGISTPAPLSR